MTDRPGTTAPASTKTSTAALRRASYAERDRGRFLDPGALDFTVDDDLDEDDDSFNQNDSEIGGKSMQRAYKILQKRSEIPEAGTSFVFNWNGSRSLTHI